MPSESTSESRYFQILDTAPDAMIVVGVDSIITFVNAQTEKLFGYPREALLGKHFETLIPDRIRSAHSAHVARYFAKPGIRSMGIGMELFGRKADGTNVPVEVSLSPFQVGDQAFVSAAIRDITQRKQIEDTARLNAERLTSAVESVQDAFALFDRNDRLVLCNSAYRSLLDHAVQGELVGRPYSELLEGWSHHLELPTEADIARFKSERLASRSEATSTFEIRTRDGRTLRVRERRTAEGGIVKTIWDLTDDVRQAEELRIARVAAEAGSAAKSEFLASMSHELRTPMNAILGFAQLLLRDKKEPLSLRQRERAAQILKGGEHLLRLIDDILDLSRIEAGAVSMSTEAVSIAEVLDSVRTTIAQLAARDGIVIEMGPMPEAVPMVVADRTRLVQILTNFGSNAVKYNRPNGKVTFSVALGSSESAGEESAAPGHVRLSVVDTGMGIPLDKQSKLFQPFQRAGQESGHIEGTGIGLVITKRLAALMNGEVGFHSEEGRGSTFWVDVPLHANLQAASEHDVPKERESMGLLSAERRRVLYVEDNPANVAFMRDLLEMFESVDLVVAPTAEMGIELARAHPPAVVLMDINLPGMSGLEALRMLRTFPETKNLPVIALTAAASERDRVRGMQAGFFMYLTKPVKVAELEAALHSVFA